jgi:ryanodine receptor 2
MPSYQPRPLDTSLVQMGPALDELMETLARNVHDQWALRRMKDGWTLGPVRDDVQKQHPCLVPFEDLPEAEKEYDRVSARETLKTILALGFRILPPV